MLTTQNLMNWLLFAQEEAVVDEPGLMDFFLNPLNLILIVGMLFYLVVLRPENRKKAELTAKLGGLKKNDRIVTIGGIFGTVVNAQEGSEDITIRVDENSNAKIRILRSAVSRVVGDEKSEKNGKTETK